MPPFNIFRKSKYQFVTEEEYEEKMTMQHLLNHKVLGLFKQHGGSKKEQQVEFFFYTDEEDKATNLAIELYGLGYEVYGVERSNKENEWSVIGRTTVMKMTTRTLTKWSKQMVELGYSYDCNFDGWGTLVE